MHDLYYSPDADAAALDAHYGRAALRGDADERRRVPYDYRPMPDDPRDYAYSPRYRVGIRGPRYAGCCTHDEYDCGYRYADGRRRDAPPGVYSTRRPVPCADCKTSAALLQHYRMAVLGLMFIVVVVLVATQMRVA